MSTAELLKKAIAEKLQVTASYEGYLRAFCPHVIGWNREGVYHVMAFQFAGSSKRGLPRGGEWRCFDVDALSGAELRHGAWHTAANYMRPQTCIVDVELDVALPVRGRRRIR